MKGSPMEGRNVWDVKKLLEVKPDTLMLATPVCQHANVQYTVGAEAGTYQNLSFTV